MPTTNSAVYYDPDLRQRLLATIVSLQDITTTLLPLLMRGGQAMSPSDKARGPPPGSPSRKPRGVTGSPSRIVRGSTASSSSHTVSANSSMARTPGGLTAIAPPPRAALSGTSSPTPDDHRNREGMTTGKPPSTTQPNKDTTTTSSSTSPSPRTSLLLRDQASRISHLESELHQMETEFQRELDKLSANESETASFWQTKHSALNQQFLRTDTELRLLRSELEVREAEREELRSDCADMRRLLRMRENEVAELRGQVRGLKEWIGNSTRLGGGEGAMMSDEVFGEGMARLGNGLQNWVISNFRRAKIKDLSTGMVQENVLGELGRLVPAYEELALKNAKIHLLQSIVSRLLVEVVFDAYFVGLTVEREREFREMERFLGSFATSPEVINQWRSSTLTILKKEAATRLQAETARITGHLVSRINTLLDAITDASSTAARTQGLTTLIETSIELSRLLVVQKAVFTVSMPEIQPYQKTLFDADTMEDIGGEELDEDGLAEREICCVTFPGIIKRGDENGGQLQYRNVIAKARVLCSPE